MTRTWIAAVLLSLAGAAPVSAAEGEAPAPVAPKTVKSKIPYRVVKLLPETQQALVFDRDHAAHLMVQIGDDLGDFQVIDVDDEELVLWRDGREVILVVDPSAPVPPAVLAHRPPTVVVTPTPAASAPPASPALLDPYAAPAPLAAPTLVAAPTPIAAPAPTPIAAPAPPPPPLAAPAPLDPYATPAVNVVLAPPDQRASLLAAEVIDPYAEPTTVTAPAGAEPIKGVPAPTSEAARATELRAAVMPLQRAQLEAAVTSFDKLAKDLGFERTARGIRLQRVPADSYAYQLGLRGGDVVTAIDGAPLRGLDDAAAIYVRLGAATQLSLDIERGTTRGTLRFSLR